MHISAMTLLKIWWSCVSERFTPGGVGPKTPELDILAIVPREVRIAGRCLFLCWNGFVAKDDVGMWCCGTKDERRSTVGVEARFRRELACGMLQERSARKLCKESRVLLREDKMKRMEVVEVSSRRSSS
jgi:hypothetical protein